MIRTKNERLKVFFDTLGISQEEFSESIEASQQYVSAIFKGKRNLGTNLIERVLKSYPKLNEYWLLFGKGSMMIGDTTIGDNNSIQTKGDNNNIVKGKNNKIVLNDTSYLQQEIVYLKREIELKDRELGMFKDNIERMERIQQDADKAKGVAVDLYERKIGDLKELIKVLKSDVELLRKQVDFYNSMRK